MISKKPQHTSLAVIILAFNEAESIKLAIHDAQAFCSEYFFSWEIIVVDDGSSDETFTIAEELKNDIPQLNVIRHLQNKGMGAAMRSGYSMATTEYVTVLPADRQIRAISLKTLIAYIGLNTVVLSNYIKPHSGYLRKIQSNVFRGLIQLLTGLRVNFEATYVFPKALFNQVQGEMIRVDSFFYSFVLLEKMRVVGCSFEKVLIEPQRREFGESKTNNLRTIKRIFLEMLKHRKSL